MDILIVSSWVPYPPDNGSQVRAYHLLRELSQRHTLTLLAFGDNVSAEDIRHLRSLCAVVEIVTPTDIDRNRLGRRGLLSATPRHLVQTWSPGIAEQVARYVARNDLAVGMQLEAVRYLLPWPKIPRVFEEVEVAVLREQYEVERHPVRRVRHGFTWWKFRRYIRDLVTRSDAATVVSEAEREHLQEIGCDASRVHVVPNGTDVPAHHAPVLTKAPRLVYPGSITYSANLDAVQFFIHEIFPLVRRARPDLEFWVTGTTAGIDVSNLSAPGVVFTGRIPEVDSVIAGSLACVVPLRIGGGTRLKVLKAASLLTPIVSTTKGIEGLALKPEQQVLLGDTPEAFSQQVLRVCSNPLLAERLAEGAQELVRARYTWPQVGAALERALQDAVFRHSRRHSPVNRGIEPVDA